MFFFVSQEFTDDLRPTDVLTHQLPDGARAARGLLADLLRQRERPGPGHAAADHQPGHGPAVPGQQDSASCAGHRRLRQRPHAPARPADAESAAHAERVFRPGQQPVQRVQLRRRHVSAPLPNEQHAAARRGAEPERAGQLQVHQGSRRQHQQQRLRAWHRLGEQRRAGLHFNGQRHPGARARTWSTKPRSGSRTTATAGIRTTASTSEDYRAVLPRRRSGVDPPRLEPFGDVPRPARPRLRPVG